MIIKNDYSYVKTARVEKGYATQRLYSVHLDRYLTEEQMQENREFAEKVGNTSIEWAARCEKIRKDTAESIKSICDIIVRFFKVGQYDHENDYDFHECDLWFWCNGINIDGEYQRDYSHISLNVEHDNMTEQRAKEIEHQLRTILTNARFDNVYARFQYESELNTEFVNAKAKELFDEYNGGFVRYGHMNGKLLCVDGKYAFKKKNAKTKGFWLDAIDVIEILEA